MADEVKENKPAEAPQENKKEPAEAAKKPEKAKSEEPAKAESKKETSPAPATERGKKINTLVLAEVEAALKAAKEKMGGFHSHYAKHLLLRKKELTAKS